MRGKLDTTLEMVSSFCTLAADASSITTLYPRKTEKVITLKSATRQFCLRSRVSDLVEEHDREHGVIQDSSIPVSTDGVVTSSHTLRDRQENLQSKKRRFCLCLDAETYTYPRILPIRMLT